jgi:hypothetical protein
VEQLAHELRPLMLIMPGNGQFRVAVGNRECDCEVLGEDPHHLSGLEQGGGVDGVPSPQLEQVVAQDTHRHSKRAQHLLDRYALPGTLPPDQGPLLELLLGCPAAVLDHGDGKRDVVACADARSAASSTRT